MEKKELSARKTCGEFMEKQFENTVEIGEIAHDEQFLLFTVFSKDLYSRHVKTRACLGKG